MAAEQNPWRRPDQAQAERWAEQLQKQHNIVVYSTSFIVSGEVTAFVFRQENQRRFGLLWESDGGNVVDAFSGETCDTNLEGHAVKFKSCPTDAANSETLRKTFPFAKPVKLGLKKSFGCGDRLGLSTPGHILAIKRFPEIFPILAQQSIREMQRTQRTAQEVMDDACWGVFQAGWDTGFGSDADHLKTFDDIDLCVKAGFLLFTIDPGDHVDDDADTDDMDTLKAKFENLPFSALKSSPDETLKRYEGTVHLGSDELTFSDEQVIRAAVKYGKAVAHTLSMFQKLVELLGEDGFELEVSVDETATPTKSQEHYYVAGELKRLGVVWQALAPRFVGEFEKGVDYIGDVDTFREAFAVHAAIAKKLGPYKLSVHSGSDKFSVYPIAAELTGELLHVKTAGTTYLEALRVLSQLEPKLFREILDFARDRYETDRASYHVSAKLENVPAGADLKDHQLPALLDEFHARQVLHVTFGSVMTEPADGGTRFRKRILDALCDHEEAYGQCLDRHIGKHLQLLS